MNFKLLLINSETLNDYDGPNLNDLFKFCKALGVFCDDERIKQRIITFINEKVFTSIKGNLIHSNFSDINPREEIDYEFMIFFIENYHKILSSEHYNFLGISRIYNSFREISNISSSHRGCQRHLKVTLEKCIEYFATQKFENISEDSMELAQFLILFYSEPYILETAREILKEAKKAPRNIFSKIKYTKSKKPIYSYDSSEDLFETNKQFTYHWLPKQDFDNLVLGKYCNCCSHLVGAGAGISRASMILDCCQNLVIRNNNGKIIAKMTIYVDRKTGIAVFNTAEVNQNYYDNLVPIYEAFKRGVNAFIERYNSNNKIQINIVTIGEYRNQLRDLLGNKPTKVYPTPNYSDYGYYVNKTFVGSYNGDAKTRQLLVYKKEIN